MTMQADPLIVRYAERLRETGIVSGPDILSDILRIAVCVSLEATIAPIEMAIAQSIERGDRQAAGARYHKGYTIFAPDMGRDRRGYAIQGFDYGYLIVLETDLRSHGTLFSRRTVPAPELAPYVDAGEDLKLPTEISVHGYHVSKNGNDRSFETLVDSIKRGFRYQLIASAGQSAFLDRRRDLYAGGCHSLMRPDAWIGLFDALRFAFAMCDLTDRMRSASEEIHRMELAPIGDLVCEAIHWIGRHLARIEEHLPSRVTTLRLGMLERHLEDESERSWHAPSRIRSLEMSP